MIKNPFLLILLPISTFFLGSCKEATKFVTPLPPEPPPIHDALTRTLTEETIQKSNDLGIVLLKDLSRDGSTNAALSAVSIESVFGYIQQATRGTTLDQINQALGDSVGFLNFSQKYSSENNGTSIANLLAVDKDLSIEKDYAEFAKSFNFQSADFTSNPEKERLALNAWVEDHTDHKIKDLLPGGSITGNTVMVALNAILFEGKWDKPFDKERTQEDVFHAPGKETKTMMMSRQGSYVFSVGEDKTTMVSLPYASPDKEKKSPLSFVILMPGEGSDFQEFVRSLTWEKASALFPKEDAQARDIILQLPRFEFKSPTIPLSSSLKKLGITEVFDAQKADFSYMTTERALALDEVYHQCYVKVDEEGTTAAAATGAVITRMSLPHRIAINRPFVWFIYDSERQVVLFCGTIVDAALLN